MDYPCDRCGVTAPAVGTCPNCGNQRTDQAQAIISWLSSMTPAQRQHRIYMEPVDNWPPSLIRSYDVSRRDWFDRESALLAEAGYVVDQMIPMESRAGIPDPGLFFLSRIDLDEAWRVVIYRRRVTASGDSSR